MLSCTSRRLGAVLLAAFAFQLVAIQAHVAHAHHELAGAIHDDVGHPPSHGGDAHDELDHVVPLMATPSGLESASHVPGPLALTAANVELPAAQVIAAVTLATVWSPFGTDPPRGPRARAPPVA